MVTHMTEALHIGRKINRIRELRGMKQEALAAELGISQQMVSKIEQSEKVEDEVLEKIASALGVSAEGIKKFSEEAVFTNISNTFNDTSYLINYQFNPVEKIVELYERLLASEREKIEMLKSQIK